MRLGLFPAEYVEQLPALEPQTRRRSSSRSASGSPSRIPDPEPELVQQLEHGPRTADSAQAPPYLLLLDAELVGSQIKLSAP